MNDETLRTNETVTVFVVDDEPEIRTLVERVLRDDGFTVVGFSNATDALAALHAGARPVVALVDIWMGELSGVEFCRAVARMEIGVTCVVMSGTTEAAHVAEELSLLLLAKPFDLDALLEVVQHPMRV